MEYRAITAENFYLIEMKNTCKFILENKLEEDLKNLLKINNWFLKIIKFYCFLWFKKLIKMKMCLFIWCVCGDDLAKDEWHPWHQTDSTAGRWGW